MKPASYCGPKEQVEPSQLARYENGSWCAEVKHDGNWCELVTDAAGTIVRLTGRSGNRFDVRTLIGTKLGLPSCTFIGELEQGTESAARMNVVTGKKRFHAFDCVELLGKSTKTLTHDKRRELLEIAFKHVDRDDVLLVERRTARFREFHDEVVARGGEGLVLKRRSSFLVNGKTSDWLKCKVHRTIDYVVMSIGKSDGGSDNFQVGLYFGGTLKRVATIKNLPRTMKDPNAFVGSVIECRGYEVHASGALRHGHFERARPDKSPRDCTIESVISASK